MHDPRPRADHDRYALNELAEQVRFGDHRRKVTAAERFDYNAAISGGQEVLEQPSVIGDGHLHERDRDVRDGTHL